MTTLLAIDPGACTGLAMFFIGPDCPPVLVNVDAIHPDAVEWSRHMPDIVIIESPQIYPNSKARPNDILTLARIVGRYEERFKSARRRLVLPREWKGSVDGDIMTKRIKADMTTEERTMIKPLKESVAHNAIDAVGLGKWSFRQAWMRGAL